MARVCPDCNIPGLEWSQSGHNALWRATLLLACNPEAWATTIACVTYCQITWLGHHNMLLKRKYLFGTTILAGVMMASAPALAQTAGQTQQDPEAGTRVEEIVVTGSRIRRDPTNAPTPLIQVEREALLTTGQSTVIDYLATIPALSNSLVPSDTTGSGLNDGGLDFANLRSLGTGRTLTLVDGRRHVGSSAGTLSVDVSTVPRLLIENIEIITGGASSIYGADAVAGVLNFILRDDFEGVEIDANYGQINQGGQATRRVSLLVGKNLLDDRLNIYGHAEYERADMVTSFDVDWINDDPRFIGIDADPTANPSDGVLDNMIFSGLNRIDRPRWGQVTLANGQQPSPLNNPLIPFFTCASAGGVFNYGASCYAVNPGKTFWFDPGQGTARLANFGQRIGTVGANRPFNYGGDGVSAADFATASRFPELEAERFQAGFTFAVLPNVNLSGEYKHVTENAFDISQPTFFNIYLDNTSYGPNGSPVIYGVQSYDLRWSDNAFLPQNVKDAIATNMLSRYGAPTATAPGAYLGDVLVQQAQYISFGPDRTQDNERVVERYVIGLDGDFDNLLFFRNVSWDVGYTRGEMNNVNAERGIDSQRFALASDAIVDAAGILGTPGAIVCRSKWLDAQGINTNRFGGGTMQASQYGQDSIDQCAPLNIFGAGNQSEEALAYIDATIRVREQNISEQALFNVSGQLWDFWGAGPIGVALGYEQRREYTEGVGRSADTAGRLLFMNTGPDFLGAEYESDEFYGEIAIPLFRDSFLGDYAEFSASYREFDYTTAGKGDVYGLNLVYRPISDIAFRTSLNTSVRVPNLAENFRPATQTFYNGVVDPCATANIINPALDPQIRANRIANCEQLAIQNGYSAGFFDWGGTTATNQDDYIPNYTSGVAGVNAGNPFLRPEESESFTFSMIVRPRMFPNLSVVLDYYHIRVDDVIAAVSARVASENCVNGTSLDMAACNTIFRRNPPTAGHLTSTDPIIRSSGFRIGAPAGDPIGGFIQGSINYAGLETEGLDFSVNYSLDTFDVLGRDWGRFSYSLNGLWLITQESYTNTSDPTAATGSAGNLFFPRVRFNSSLTYAPNDIWSVNWTADWQTSQQIFSPFSIMSNIDNVPADALKTGAFTRHDFTFRWNVRDDLSMRAGVVNAFDNEQNPYLQGTLYNNFDAWGRRFFIGLNYRPW